MDDKVKGGYQMVLNEKHFFRPHFFMMWKFILIDNAAQRAVKPLEFIRELFDYAGG